MQAHALYEPTWRAGKGAGIFFEPRSVPAIERFVAGLARHFNLTGQVAFDFIEDYAGPHLRAGMQSARDQRRASVSTTISPPRS